MKKTQVINDQFLSLEPFLKDCIENFETKGEPFGDQDRNSLKLFKTEKETLNVKSFKTPNIVNQIAYKFFRKSKAQRSYEYAKILTNLQVGTPQPIAYFEFTSALLFKKSYYISEQQACDLTFRELTTDLDYPEHEIILRAFTRFTFELHEKGINFLDHSPGNTLITKMENQYEFALVDLNRMEFKTMDFESRIKNLSRLTIKDELVSVMSDEYAKLIQVPTDKVYSNLWNEINTFQNKIKRRKILKKKLLFRK
ncbi:Kdo domain containing protein [Flavobacteriales bacterium 34_180_T64]|nr:Kdo domain containing protein [Flavobacteriales bacterium 34_180_T64]